MLPGIPAEETSLAEDLSTWNARMDLFNRMADERGGLLPQSVLPQILRVSPTRVSELIQTGRLERVNFFGVPFVTGRSINAHKTEEKMRGGRGHKRLSLWQSVTIGARIGRDLANAVTSDR